MLLSADDDTFAAIISPRILYVTSRLYAKPRDIEKKQHQKDLLCISLENMLSNLSGVTVGIVLKDHHRSNTTLQLYLRLVTTKAP
jgi:hypothetical protein